MLYISNGTKMSTVLFPLLLTYFESNITAGQEPRFPKAKVISQ